MNLENTINSYDNRFILDLKLEYLKIVPYNFSSQFKLL